MNRAWPGYRRTGRTIALVILLGCLLVSEVRPNSRETQYKEYQIKAAFLYNFLKFVDWPKEKMTSSGNQIIIGIIGKDPFGPAADVFKDKSVEDRKLVVERFEGFVSRLYRPDTDEGDARGGNSIQGSRVRWCRPSSDLDHVE